MQSRIIISSEEEVEGGGRDEKGKNGIIVMELVKGAVIEVEKMEFWPLKHPMEPDDEDRPVICPIPNSASILHIDGTMHNGKRTPESWRKRTEVSREVKAAAETTAVRPVRKRHHHTLSRPDHPTIAEMSPLPPPPMTPQNFTIYQMLQQLDNKFEP